MVSGLKESRKEYFQEYFHSNIGNMTLLWKRIKSIINKDSRANAINKLMDTKVKPITDSETMATILNDFIVNVTDCITQKYLDHVTLDHETHPTKSLK